MFIAQAIVFSPFVRVGATWRTIAPSLALMGAGLIALPWSGGLLSLSIMLALVAASGRILVPRLRPLEIAGGRIAARCRSWVASCCGKSRPDNWIGHRWTSVRHRIVAWSPLLARRCVALSVGTGRPGGNTRAGGYAARAELKTGNVARLRINRLSGGGEHCRPRITECKKEFFGNCKNCAGQRLCEETICAFGHVTELPAANGYGAVLGATPKVGPGSPLFDTEKSRCKTSRRTESGS